MFQPEGKRAPAGRVLRAPIRHRRVVNGTEALSADHIVLETPVGVIPGVVGGVILEVVDRTIPGNQSSQN